MSRVRVKTEPLKEMRPSEKLQDCFFLRFRVFRFSASYSG